MIRMSNAGIYDDRASSYHIVLAILPQRSPSENVELRASSALGEDDGINGNMTLQNFGVHLGLFRCRIAKMVCARSVASTVKVLATRVNKERRPGVE